MTTHLLDLVFADFHFEVFMNRIARGSGLLDAQVEEDPRRKPPAVPGGRLNPILVRIGWLNLAYLFSTRPWYVVRRLAKLLEASG